MSVSLKDLLRQRVLLVDLLAVLFGIASWISINGLWVQLPLLVQELPEQWKLPSYLSIIVQVANIGPISYSLMKSCFKSPPSPHWVITLVLVVGVLSSLGLALSWDWVASVASTPHSLGLFISVFCLSLVDCTSSVLFLPYMGLFSQLYLNSYLIGEGMSGFVPSIAALVQGVSGNPTCTNRTLENGTVVIEAVTGQPRFSTSSFFLFLMAMMTLSLVAFLLLQHLPPCQRERAGPGSSFLPCSPSPSHTNFTEVLHTPQPDGDSLEGDKVSLEPEASVTPQCQAYSLPLLLGIQGVVSMLSNGALPSIQPYSCLPYGNTVYHLSVTLNAMANPLMAFLAFFLPCCRQTVVTALTAVSLVLSTFILATALTSPHMVGGPHIGGTLVVIVWVFTGALFSYVKVSVAGMCREAGWLFQCGMVTQAGSALGAATMFLLVNQVELFEGYNVTCEPS